MRAGERRRGIDPVDLPSGAPEPLGVPLPLPDPQYTHLVDQVPPTAPTLCCGLTAPAFGPAFYHTGDPALVTCPAGVTLGDAERVGCTCRPPRPGTYKQGCPMHDPTPRAYTPPDQLREVPRYTLTEALDQLPSVDVSGPDEIVIDTRNIDRIYLPPPSPEGKLSFYPRYNVGPEALDVLRDAVHQLSKMGQFIIPPTDDENATDIRIGLVQLSKNEEAPALTVLAVQALIDYAAFAAGHPDVERPKVFTLDEARPLILGELCRSEGGHDLENVTASSIAGKVAASVVRCCRCKATFSEDPR